jgi:hypothetical protein
MAAGIIEHAGQLSPFDIQGSDRPDPGI